MWTAIATALKAIFSAFLEFLNKPTTTEEARPDGTEKKAADGINRRIDALRRDSMSNGKSDLRSGGRNGGRSTQTDSQADGVDNG